MARGQPAAPAISMTERQYRLLSKHGQKHSLSIGTKKRIDILLKASRGQSNASVKREVGVDLNTVKSWRRRWESEYESLQAFELGENDKGVSDKSLLERMLVLLKDNQRSGAPNRITLAQKEQIVALACENPEDYGIEMSRWTHEMLAHVAKSRKIVDTISPRYVGKILKKKGTPSP